MAHSGAAHSNVSPATVILGTPIVKWSKLAATDVPSQWVYHSAAGTATKVDIATEGHHYNKLQLIEFKPRMEAGVRKDCDDAYTTANPVPIIIGGRMGPLKVVGACVNPGADVYVGRVFELGATAGSVQLVAWRSHAGLTGNAILAHDVVYAAETVSNTHVRGTFLMY